MKMMNSLVVSALMVLGTSAFAAPQVKVITVGGGASDKGLFASWSNVCVENVTLQADVQTQVRYGGDAGQWQDYTIPQNTIYVFSQKVPHGDDPMVVSVQFPTIADGAVLSYDLVQTTTGMRSVDCANLSSYQFLATDGGNGAIDLVPVQ